MKIVMIAGGTAGHIFPALALADKFKEENDEVLFFGSKYRMEKDVIPQSEYEFIGLDIKSFAGNIINKFSALFKLINVYFYSRKYLKKNKIDLVVGFGNYITVPTLLAAKHLKIKTMIHEQNAYPGKANIFLSTKVNYAIGSYNNNLNFFNTNNTYVFGNPQAYKATLFQRDDEMIKAYGLDPSKKLVVAFMGSLGSSTMCDIMYDVLKEMNDENIQFIFATGRAHYNSFKEKFNDTNNVKIVEKIDGAKMLANADLAITRAGATTICELAALKIPAILVPSPYVPDNGQYLNAIELKNKNACILVKEKDIKVEELISLINETINDDRILNEMKNNLDEFANIDASDKIIDLVKRG